MRGFSLVEVTMVIVLIAIVLFAVFILDMVGHNFYQATTRQSKVQNESEIAMEHITKYLRLGVGDMSNPRSVGEDPFDASGCSRGVYILDNNSLLSASGSSLFVKIDYDNDGQFTGTPADRTARYDFDAVTNVINCIIEPDIFNGPITDAVITNCQFSIALVANQVDIIIESRDNPTQAAGPKNPEISLSSSVVLPGMSTN